MRCTILAVFNFSETPSEHPLHGFTPDVDGPAATPIPVATSFRPPPGGAPQHQAKAAENSAMPPPPTTPATASKPLAAPIHPAKRRTAAPAGLTNTPSAAHLLKTRALAALQPSATATQTPPAPNAPSPATNAPCGLLWEGEQVVSAPAMRVPKKNDNLPSTQIFELNDLLDEDEDPFGW